MSWLEDATLLGARPSMFEGEPREEGIATIRVTTSSPLALGAVCPA